MLLPYAFYIQLSASLIPFRCWSSHLYRGHWPYFRHPSPSAVFSLINKEHTARGWDFRWGGEFQEARWSSVSTFILQPQFLTHNPIIWVSFSVPACVSSQLLESFFAKRFLSNVPWFKLELCDWPQVRGQCWCILIASSVSNNSIYSNCWV